MSLSAAAYVVAAAFAVAGLLSVYVALTGADWFFRSPGVRMLVGRLSRTGARVVYAVAGLAILAMAAAVAADAAAM